MVEVLQISADSNVSALAGSIIIASGELSAITDFDITDSEVFAENYITVATGIDSQVGDFNIQSSTITADTEDIIIASGDNSKISDSSDATVTDFNINNSTIFAKNNITVASGDTAIVDGFTIKDSTITADTGKIEIASGTDSEIKTKFDIDGSTITAQGDITVAKGNNSKAKDAFTISNNSKIESKAGSLTFAEGNYSEVVITATDTEFLAKQNITIAEGTGSTGIISIKSNSATKNLTAEAGYLTIADGNGSTGTLDVTNMDVAVGQFIRVADGNIDSNNDDKNSTGTFNVTNSEVTAGTYIEFADAAKSVGTFTANNSTVKATDGHFMLANLGQATMTVSNGGIVNIQDAGNDSTPEVNEQKAGYATFAKGVTGYAKGTVDGDGSQFNVDHDLIVGEAGTGLLFVNNKATVTVGGDHIIADKSSNGQKSFGRDVVSNKGSLEVTGDLYVGKAGNAGGFYDYIGVGYEGGAKQDPTPWGDSNNLTAAPRLPDGITPDSNWASVQNNSPGLAILNGSTVEVTKSAYAGAETGGYAYILLDNKNSSTPNTLNITENFYVADKGEAYVRIINGSLVDVGGDMIVGNQGKDSRNTNTSNYAGHGTVRINGNDSNHRSATLTVGDDLIVGNEAGSQGYLYVHDSGKVNVTGNHTIGNETGSFGRDHFDGQGTTLEVGENLRVGNSGQAGGQYEYRINELSNPDPAVWFDSANLLLEKPTSNRPSGIVGSTGTIWDTDRTVTNNNLNDNLTWSDIEKNAPGLALTDGAKGTAENIYAGTQAESFSYILIDDKPGRDGSTSSDQAGLKATANMEIADKGTAYVRVLNGGQLEVGTEIDNDSLIIAKSAGSQGTLRIGDTDGGTQKSLVNVTGTLITAQGAPTSGNIAEGYLYANNGSTTQVTGTHIAAENKNSFGREHFNGNGTTLTVTSVNNNNNTIIAQSGQSGGQYRYVVDTGIGKGGSTNDPTVRTELSNDNNGKWFDSANLLLEPDQIIEGNNVNYPNLTWNDVKNNSPGFALTAGAVAATNNTIVAQEATGYAYILLDNVDNSKPIKDTNRTAWNITNGDSLNKANLTLGNKGDAYARVINGSVLSVQNNMIVANENDYVEGNATQNNQFTEATIRINSSDSAGNNATLNVGNDLTVANNANTEGNLYAYEAAKVTVGNASQHTGNFTIAAAAESYGRAHFDGETTTASVGGTLTVGESGQAGLAYIYKAHLGYDSDTNTFNNKLNDPTQWFDSVNTLDDDINNASIVGSNKNGYTINENNNRQRAFAGNLVQQNNAPGLAITDGAKVTSGIGMTAQENTSNGYIVIDNKGNHQTGRSTWTINHGSLTIAEHGNAYVRVLNGAMLNTTSSNNDGHVIIAADTESRGTLRVQDKVSQLIVKDNLITAKNGAAGQDNVAIGNFYLHDQAQADVGGNHTIAEGIYSEGRDHIDGNGTTMTVNETLTVGQYGYAGNYVYHQGDSDNAKDPTNNATEYSRWFDSANTLLDYNDADLSTQQKENMPGLAITAGAVVTSGDGMIAKFATVNTPTLPADSNGTAYRSQGYFVIDNANSTAGNRSTWNVVSNYFGDGDLTVAREGTGYGRVLNGALLNVANDMVIADLSDGDGSGDARSRGTVRVYGTGDNNVSTLKVGGDLTAANEGTGSLYLYQEATGTVGNDHTIATAKGSYGNDHIDGHGTRLDVEGTLTAGDYGQAGGRYDYIENGKDGGIAADPDQWFDSDNTLLTPDDTGWDDVKNNAPGLAITAGAVVTSGGGMAGQHRNADGTQGYGYVVIDSKDKSVRTDRSTWIVKENLTVAENGEAYVRVINGSLLKVGNDMIIGSDEYGYGTVRVNHTDPITGTPSELIVHGNLTTGGNGTNNNDYATGNLYAHDQAQIQVDGDHVIADGQYSVGRDHIDGAGTTMNVDKTLTVGKSGAAGGWYQENRYVTQDNNALGVTSTHYYFPDPTALGEYGERWLDSEVNTLENLDRTFESLGNPENAQIGKTTGNAPGLAITAGAAVTSGSGKIAENETANGYVLIDDKRIAGDSNDESVRTRWIVQNDGTPFGTDGQLVVGGAGTAFVRVLNGSLLQADSTVIAQKGNNDPNPDYKAYGYLYVVGGKENPKDAAGNNIKLFDALTGEETFWQPSEWISKGATVIGENAGNERGTLRIEEGAHGVTSGLYLGLAAGSQGEVSVSGTHASPNDTAASIRSLLEIYEDKNSPFKNSTPKGSSTLSVSDYGYLWMHQNSKLKLNGVGIISNGAILHLSEDKEKSLGLFNVNDSAATAGNFDGNPIAQNNRTALLDAMKSKVTIINARIEGDGTVTGEDGVFIAHDAAHNSTNSKTEVDPGQRYDWNSKNEYFAYYGTLTFGDSLRMSTDDSEELVTNFDVNSGYYPGMGGTNEKTLDVHNKPVTPRKRNADLIVVQRGPDSNSKADVLAQLSGTLNVHARLTDYYMEQDNDILVVQTLSETNKPGTIVSMFDNLKVMPERFFDDPHQEIRQDSEGNDQLWVTLKRKNNPFESAGNSYNEKQTGKGLDSVYLEQIQTVQKNWLPVLRNFWYIDDNDEFLNAYRWFSGEVRAHSLLLPMTTQWRYAHNRIDYRTCMNPKHNHLNPCDESEGVPEHYIRCGAAKNRWKEKLLQLTKNARLWGSVIYDDTEMDNDGNAADSRLHRYGVVVGADRPFLRPESHIGIMIGLGRAKLNTYQASAQNDDLNVGLYHGTKLFNNNWEWKNYLGVGVQDYSMNRDVTLNLTDLNWNNDEYGFINNPLGDFGGKLTSDFLGYSLSGSTEFARPLYFGSCGEYMFRPYFALDLAMVWQNSTSENGHFTNSELIALDYLSATNIRVFGRPGFLLERNGRHSTWHAGLAYAFLMGGRRYTNVDNQFQVGGTNFNVRGTDDGNGYFSWNFGGNVYLGKRKLCSIILDYWGTAGSHSITQSAQLGFQKKF
ncbi:MAG: hypothetical protein LBG58_14175 [Planctomycetaceae bacterium]|nr:hypothetical protein [Planctomycetaceae bacterium]